MFSLAVVGGVTHESCPVSSAHPKENQKNRNLFHFNRSPTKLFYFSFVSAMQETYQYGTLTLLSRPNYVKLYNIGILYASECWALTWHV